MGPSSGHRRIVLGCRIVGPLPPLFSLLVAEFVLDAFVVGLDPDGFRAVSSLSLGYFWRVIVESVCFFGGSC